MYLYDGDAASSEQKNVFQIGMFSQQPGNDVEYWVGENADGRDTKEVVSENGGFLSVEFQLLDSVMKKRSSARIGLVEKVVQGWKRFKKGYIHQEARWRNFSLH